MGTNQISYPNQYNTTICKTACDKNNTYTIINLDALQNAMKCLNGSALTLWLYLAKNQDNYNLWLSKTAAIEWGLPERSYFRARDELKDKGFLVESSPNHFKFYEYPINENECQNGTVNGECQNGTQ